MSELRIVKRTTAQHSHHDADQPERLPGLRAQVIRIGWLAILLGLFVVQSHASPAPLPDLPPDRQSPIKAARFNERPVLDGKLDDEVWRQAGVLKDFFQTEPGDNVKPPHPTEVRIGYDAKFLYLGIHASDQQGQVRSTVAK